MALLKNYFILQVYEVLKLANQLIPPVLRDVPDDQIELAKEKILVDQPNFLHEFSTDILPVSVQVCFYK